MAAEIEKYVLAFDGDLFGAYVRDVKIQGSISNSICFRIDPIHMGPFLNVLSLHGNIVPVDNSENRYARTLMYNDIITLTIIPLRKFDFRAIPCNFDCDALAWNNECMYVWKNNPATRYMMDKLSWITERIKQKRFCLLQKNYVEDSVEYVIEKAYNLVSNDWVMDTSILGKGSWTVNYWSVFPLEQKMQCTDCAICQDDFHQSDIVVRTCCSHNFHWRCRSKPLGLQSWVNTNKQHVTCPKCRLEMF